jgi:putative flippase GtrA
MPRSELLTDASTRTGAALPPIARAGARERAIAVVTHRESRHVLKYAVVGVANVTIDVAIYAALVHLGIWYLAAKVLSLSVATLNGYTFNRIWTFRAGDHEHMKLARYVTVQGSGLLLNLALLTLLVEVIGVGKVVAAVVAVPFVAAFCFLGNRLWTFGRHIEPVRDRP